MLPRPKRPMPPCGAPAPATLRTYVRVTFTNCLGTSESVIAYMSGITIGCMKTATIRRGLRIVSVRYASHVGVCNL
jgi:hypothetical protein